MARAEQATILGYEPAWTPSPAADPWPPCPSISRSPWTSRIDLCQNAGPDAERIFPMVELADPLREDRAYLTRSVGPVVLERRSSDGGWTRVWEYEKSEEARRAVDARISADGGSLADYRVRPLEHRSRIQNLVLAGFIAVVVAVCLATLVVALIR